MNSILQLKGKFKTDGNHSKPGPRLLPKNEQVSSEHIIKLSTQLATILKYWESNTQIGGALVSVHYKRVIPKSHRIQKLLSLPRLTTLDSICGAKFEWIKSSEGRDIPTHVFTHYVPLKAIKNTIEWLNQAATIAASSYNSVFTYEDTVDISKNKLPQKYNISKTFLLNIIADCFDVDSFQIDEAEEIDSAESIITIYETGVDTKKLLAQFGIEINNSRIIGNTTLHLMPDEVKKLYNKAPYLIAMGVTDFTKLTIDDFEESDDEYSIIQTPSNEPVIGVIDTLFDENVYFSEWVEYHNMLDKSIPTNDRDTKHGTAVSSIIVDGPRGNPSLDDGCGNFRVRHFGVATATGFSSFMVLKLIREIVMENRDIKVWNLSLGSVAEIKQNFISPEAAELDRIQSEYDVIFVVAGTNKPLDKIKTDMRIGAPADSLNSLVVNSVDFNRKSASYTRTGPVLSFFHKPDISYFGGDKGNGIAICKDNMGVCYGCGTSYAAPWISRKLAYLIHIMGMTREVAKALLIDTAAGWNRQDDISHKIGYGIVPINIKDIVETKDDEIRFILVGEAAQFETYTYNLPVPMIKKKDKQYHPFFARATITYFPECNRNHGVDYTNTEMDFHFGRIDKDGNLKSINNNKQSDKGLNVIYEDAARKQYRKWDNVKHISDTIKKRSRLRDAYNGGLWGISIKMKERMGKKQHALPFGIVVTLKEMNGVNRIYEFIKACEAREWLVNILDVDNKHNIYMMSEEELILE